MTGSDEAQMTLKVVFNGDVRRLKGQDFSSEAAIRMAVAHLYSIASVQAQDFTMCYTDDEGDSCTLTEATLTDCLSCAVDSKNILHLQCSWGSPGRSMESAIQAERSEEQPKLTAEQEISSEVAMVADPELPGQVTQEVESEAAEVRTLQDQVAQTVDDVIAAASGARAKLTETSQDISERLTSGVAELRASTSNVLTTGQDVSASMRGFMAQKVAQVSTQRQEFTDRVQVQMSELAGEARATAANMCAKAATAYEQASEGDVKPALGLAAGVGLAFRDVAVSAAREVGLISKNTSDTTEFTGSETANAEGGMPAEHFATNDAPSNMAGDAPDEVTGEALGKDVKR